MEIKLNGRVVALTKKDNILFSGVDLNPTLDMKLITVEPREDEDGVIYYDYVKPTLLAKLAYLETLGYTIVPESKKETKSLESNPLILRPNEVLNDDRLEKSIKFVLKENEKKIKSLIEKEIGQNTIKEIKSLDGIIKAIKSLLTFAGIKSISDAVINQTFMKGWDDAERQIDRNILLNKGAVEFIQDYTFANIKGMTDEIADDLRQELQRGIIDGEGITKIKARISKVFDVGENRASMIARTETNRAENQGKLQAFKSSGVELLKKWSTHEDDRTSPICKRLDGQVVGINESFKDKVSGWEGTAPPAHVNCRSSVLYLRPEEIKDGKKE